MIGLIMAAALAGGQDWTAQLDPAGWDLLDEASDGSSVIYAQRARTPNSVWVRMEYRDGVEGYYSDRALQEVDCGQWRSRLTSLVAYRDHNLTGERWDVGSDGVWDYPAPGTVAEAVMIYHCGDAR